MRQVNLHLKLVGFSNFNNSAATNNNMDDSNNNNNNNTSSDSNSGSSKSPITPLSQTIFIPGVTNNSSNNNSTAHYSDDELSSSSSSTSSSLCVAKPGGSWTPREDDLLMTTYQLYLQDPTLAPFAGRLPPSGIVHKVAKLTLREARRHGKTFSHSLNDVRKRLLVLCRRPEFNSMSKARAIMSADASSSNTTITPTCSYDSSDSILWNSNANTINSNNSSSNNNRMNPDIQQTPTHMHHGHNFHHNTDKCLDDYHTTRQGCHHTRAHSHHDVYDSNINMTMNKQAPLSPVTSPNREPLLSPFISPPIDRYPYVANYTSQRKRESLRLKRGVKK